MGSMNCMNESCRGTTSCDWKKGWGLKSGGFAKLCYSCGSAYENSFFCETFHLEESGWRECRVCRKRIHCGCIASRHLFEYTDFGGICCTNCVKRPEVHSIPSPIQIPVDAPNGPFVVNGVRDVRPTIPENRIDGDKFTTKKLLQMTTAIGTNIANSAIGQLKQDDSILKPGESSKHLLNLAEQSSESAFLKSDHNRPKEGVKPMYESLVHQSITFSVTSPLTSSSIGMPFPGGIIEGSEQNKSSSQQGQRARHILPKPPKSSSTPGSETKKGTSSQARVARPPAEGRGRNQLLPRYWPRITDQELQQLSGDLKSRIVPLFEKILSASDAGRIGRLVLPKACAEAYFPAINQSEGIPIRIQDIKGKEWTFQFRFWPNNNSRMYVLEGVTPCIQNMQVQAGDTVTFSRIDPGGKLVIGCRKTTNNADVQDPQTAALPNGDSAGGTSVSGVTGNGSSNGARAPEDPLQRHASMLEKKKARNIKNKRLVMHSDDVMDLRVTWEEAQELLRPSPTSKPTVVMVEDHEFEEFDEPPVFGKRTVFTARLTGEKEQLAQCDSCSKWRRLPAHVLLPAQWTCSDNIWDSERNSCAAAEDINPKDVENIIGIYRDSKKRRISSDNRVSKEGEPSGLDALATAAALGDNLGDIAESSVGATTRHPRHRPGCTCIVCIQPPSGKGKHDPSCKCNVCLTVKRRFRTLMMRKKKREAELAQGKGNNSDKNGSERETITGDVLLNVNHPNNEINQNGSQMDVEETNKGQLDLNCDPRRGDGILAGAVQMNLTTVVNPATIPSDVCPAQNELPIVGPSPQTVAESKENVADQLLTSPGAKQENNHADG